MKKFHDEFFKKGSAEHDELVLKCVSREGKLKIIETVKETFGVKTDSVWVCDCANIPHCKSQEKTAWKFEHECAECTGDCRQWKACENYDETKNPFPKNKQITRITCSCPKNVNLIFKEPSVSHQSEVICKTGNGFIIGYADLFFYIDNLPIDADLGNGWIWNDFYTTDGIPTSRRPIKKILIEVKPRLKDFGSVLRQLKTYMDILRDRVERLVGVICTYSELEPAAIDLLKQEGIAVVKFDKNPLVETLK